MFKSLLIAGLFSFGVSAATQDGLSPLPALNAGAWADLSALQTIVGNAHYVGLGESVHATEGYSQAKLRVIKYLIENMGFRAFGIESPWNWAKPTMNYVASCQGTPEQAAQGIFPVWYGQSFIDLLQYLCTYNQQHPQDPVIFFGFDDQNSPMEMISDLIPRVEKVSPADADAVKSGLVKCFGYNMTLNDYLKLAGQVEDGTVKISDADNASCLAGIDTLDKLITSKSDATKDDWRWISIDAVGIRSQQGEFYYAKDVVKSYQARDVGMAYDIDAFHDMLAPGKKTILWAHNAHLANNLAAVPAEQGGFHNMGSYLMQRHGADYAPIALVGWNVVYHWPGQGIATIDQPIAGSGEDLLHAKFAGQAALVDLHQSFFKPGQVYQLWQADMVPAEQYRGLIFLDHVDPMQAPQ